MRFDPYAAEARQIYSRGTKLADVPPDFRGISLLEWSQRDMREQCDAALKLKIWGDPKDRKWYQRAVATPRDNYGK